MTRAEFAAEFRKVLAVCGDSYIRANLKSALDLYVKDLHLPPPKVFVRDPRNLCVHGNPLGGDCDPCMESYGNAQPVMGKWVDPPAALTSGQPGND